LLRRHINGLAGDTHATPNKNSAALGNADVVDVLVEFVRKHPHIYHWIVDCDQSAGAVIWQTRTH